MTGTLEALADLYSVDAENPYTIRMAKWIDSRKVSLSEIFEDQSCNALLGWWGFDLRHQKEKGDVYVVIHEDEFREYVEALEHDLGRH